MTSTAEIFGCLLMNALHLPIDQHISQVEAILCNHRWDPIILQIQPQEHQHISINILDDNEV